MLPHCRAFRWIKICNPPNVWSLGFFQDLAQAGIYIDMETRIAALAGCAIMKSMDRNPNSTLDPAQQASLFARLALPLLFLLLLGIAPRPRVLEQAFQQAGQALRNGNYTAAAEAFTTLAQVQPWQPSLWEEAGRAAFNAGDIPKAVDHLQLAQNAGVLSSEGQILLGDAYQLAGDEEKAEAAWQALLATGNAPPGIYLRMANAQRLRGEIPAAIDTLQTLLQNHPGSASTSYELALLLAATHPEAALPYLEQAAELDPSLAPRLNELKQSINTARFEEEPAYTLINAGRALANLQEWALANHAFEQATEARPDYAEAWAYLGNSRERLGEDGSQALDQALSLNPDSLAANLFMAMHFVENEQPAMGLIYLYNAARLAPDTPEIEIEIGNLLAGLGNLTDARRHYERAVQADAQNPEIWRMTAEFALQYNVDVRDLALSAARQAVLLAPKDPAAIDTLGQVYFKLGDALSARRFFQRALQQDPGYALAHLHMGLYFLLEGDKASAQKRFQLVLDLAPDSQASDQAQRLLTEGIP